MEKDHNHMRTSSDMRSNCSCALGDANVRRTTFAIVDMAATCPTQSFK
jgi:hypothetical protein